MHECYLEINEKRINGKAISFKKFIQTKRINSSVNLSDTRLKVIGI